MSNKRLLTVIATLLLFFGKLSAQSTDDMRFASYLLKMNLDSEFVHLMKETKFTTTDSNSKADSIHWLKAQYFDKNEQIDSAYFHFKTIPDNSPLFEKSKYWATYEFMRLNTAAKIDLNQSDTISQMGKTFQLGALLFNRNIPQFEQKRTMGNSLELNTFKDTYNELKLHKKKSGFVAGTLSAIIPGLGKVYAGKKYEGISNFLPVTVMAAQFYEAARKSHTKADARFIISATLFSVFYIGNIWGSALSVSVARQEFDNKIDNEILFSLRMSLDNFCK